MKPHGRKWRTSMEWWWQRCAYWDAKPARRKDIRQLGCGNRWRKRMKA